MNATAKRKILDRACEELMMLADTPDASTLEQVITRYPEVAQELTDFAVEWTVQDLQPAVGEDSIGDWDEGLWDDEASSSAVDTAMAELRRRLAAESANPFDSQSPEELSGLAARLGLDKTLIAKLRHRRIEPSSVPASLCVTLAAELHATLEVFRRHLETPPAALAGVSFKSDDTPLLGAQESFADAVARSTLSADAQNRWLDETTAPRSSSRAMPTRTPDGD